MDQLPGRSDNAIKNRYHIISKDNYAEHNRASVKKAFEARQAHAKESPPSTESAAESNQIKLVRFRLARAALDQKIMDLLIEQKGEFDEPVHCCARSKDQDSPTEPGGGLIFRQTSNATVAAIDFDFSSDLGRNWEEEEGEEEGEDAATNSTSVSASVSATYDSFVRSSAKAQTMSSMNGGDDSRGGYLGYLGVRAAGTSEIETLQLSMPSSDDQTDTAADVYMGDFWTSECSTPFQYSESLVATNTGFAAAAANPASGAHSSGNTLGGPRAGSTLFRGSSFGGIER